MSPRLHVSLPDPGGRTDYPQKEAGVDGAILRTTLACLTLEAFYRYNKAAFPLGK